MKWSERFSEIFWIFSDIWGCVQILYPDVKMFQTLFWSPKIEEIKFKMKKLLQEKCEGNFKYQKCLLYDLERSIHV